MNFNTVTPYFYDSPASYMLGVIIEKVTGKTFLDYIKDKALLDIGFSKESYCLKCPGGYAWGDSAVMCTSRDLLFWAWATSLQSATPKRILYLSLHLIIKAAVLQDPYSIMSFIRIL